ncbi:MAG TPA: amidohydrolase family protein [Xanthobacteraceae bacterium]|nr:amidohydrolase family protein [Xanthobacteraceae bacterium]
MRVAGVSVEPRQQYPNVIQACGCGSRRTLLKSLAALGAAATLPPAALPIAACAQAPASPVDAASPPYRIDVHHHFFPQFLLEAWQKAGTRNPPFVQGWKLEGTLEQMDRGGVATAILSLPTGLNLPDLNTEQSRRLTRLINEYVATAMKDHPGRFGLFAFVPMPDIDGSLKEIEYALDTLKADGIGLNTSYGDKWLGHADFKPVMDELNRRKAIVYVHPRAPQCCGNLMPNVPASYVEFPQDTNRAVMNLLLSGTFTRTRDIRWIFSHAGGAVPLLAGRVNSLAKMFKSGADALPDGVDFELKRLYYETANAAYAPNMAALLAYVSVAQVLFGTDYPFISVTENVTDLSKVALSEPDRRAIERDNATRLIARLKA